MTSEDISIDSMSIAGHAIGSYQPQYENHFYIYYTMQASDTEGPLTYSLTGHDAAGNSTTATGGGVTFDKTEPTATISYSTTAPTNSDVTATITPSEAVTITNNSGLTTYTFTDNGSFTFEFRDAAGNTGSATAIVNNIDKTDPAVPTASPAGGDYYSDQTVTLTAEEGAEIRYTTDGTEPTKSTGTVYSGTILVSVDTVIKAITVDSAGNVSPVMTETYGIAPLISNEASASVTTDSVTITWTTDDLSTSRVVYDTVSHSLGSGTNYGYANSTVEDTSKVTSHSVTITGLVSGTTYYYRVISHGSPESIGDELSFKTTSTTTSTTTSSSDTGTVSGATTSTPVCNDTKPASAPFGLTAVAGLNSVTLTWNKASDPVSYYLVTYGTSSGSQAYGNPNVGGSGTTSYTVTGLSGGTTYFFKVRAGNGCAPGEYSNEASATPLGGYIEGVSPGFEAGVLGEATGSAGLNGEGPTPTTTVVNVGQVLGVGTVLKNKLFVFGLPIAFILLLIIFFLKKRKKEIS